MELFVNGNKLDITLENEKTIGDVLSSFEKEAAKNNATTIAIVLNGKLIPAKEFDKTAAKPIEKDTKLELSVISQNDIAASFEDEAKEALDIASKLENIPAQLQSGKDKEADSIITMLADLIDKFCHTASLSALFPEIYKKMTIDGKNISQFFKDFSPVFKDFEKALQSKDTVLIGDLAEYEISPRLRSLSDSISHFCSNK